jgi:tripartite-type tricarboxylate transporter receptor subunit TctC
LIVGLGPGGGYDLSARTLARYIGKYIPGDPTVIVENMPGGGGLRAANYLYNVAPKDGSVFAVIARDLPMVALVKHDPNIEFDPRRFTWLGSSSSFATDAYILLVGPSATSKSVADAKNPKKRPLVLAATGIGATDSDIPRVLEKALGLHIKVVTGYPDSPSIFRAVESGEVDGRMFDLSSVKELHPNWLNPKSGYHVLLQFGRTVRHPDLMDVPTARELATDKAGLDLIEFTETPLLTMARPYAAPPDVPSDRAEALRHAFVEAHKDPGFLKEANKLGLDISPVGAQEVIQGINLMAGASPNVKGYVRQLLN